MPSARYGEPVRTSPTTSARPQDYEIFAAYWPFVDDPLGKQFTAATNMLPTRTLKDLTWQNSKPIRDAAKDVRRLKEGSGPRLLVQGSSDLIQTPLADDLIDEIKLLVFPVLLGKGKRFFGDGTRPESLDGERHGDPPIGVAMATYRRSGPVKTGSFASDKPTPQELARRAKMKREG